MINMTCYFFSEKYYKLIDSTDVNAELVGSWSTIIGDQDQTFHVWRYIGGYSEVDKARLSFNKNAVSWDRSKNF